MDDAERLNGVNVIHAALPYEMSKTKDGRKLVKWRSQKKDSNEEFQDGFYNQFFLIFNFLIKNLIRFYLLLEEFLIQNY